LATLRLNKPYDVLCQFSEAGARRTLAECVRIADVYPAGRLDRDSEGLLLLTDDGALQHRISHPSHKLSKIYWVQVEGDISAEAIQHLRRGVQLKDGMTRPATVKKMNEPDQLWQRDPPIRVRAAIPTSWIQLQISEGRNRQVRRMTAAVGFPTLRLIRYAIGSITLDGLQPGEFDSLDETELWSLFPEAKKKTGRTPRRSSEQHRKRFK